MEHEVTFRYTRAIADLGTRRYFWRRFGRREVPLSIVSLAAAFGLWFLADIRHWLVAALGSVATLIVLLLGLAFLVQRVRARAFAGGLVEPEITWVFSTTGVTTRSEHGGAEVPWSDFAALWRFSDVWLLFVAPGAYSALPANALSEEVRHTIEEGLRRAGAEVI